MIIVVNDANILIDLIKLDLLPNFFALGYEFHTTDLIIDELYDHQQEILDQYVRLGILQIDEISPDQMMEIAMLNMANPKLSPEDCSAYHMAATLDAVLVTSDNLLRRFSKANNIDVHGHLWVFDRMVELQTLTPQQACDKLDKLSNVVNRHLKLPIVECKKRIKKWKGI